MLVLQMCNSDIVLGLQAKAILYHIIVILQLKSCKLILRIFSNEWIIFSF